MTNVIWPNYGGPIGELFAAPVTIPLTVISTLGDVAAIPFRRSKLFVEGEIHGTIVSANGQALPWESKPLNWADERFGHFPLQAWTESFHKKCGDAKPCPSDKPDKSVVQFRTDKDGKFRFSYWGHWGPMDYFQLHFGPPLDVVLNIVRRKDGSIVVVDSQTQQEIDGPIRLLFQTP